MASKINVQLNQKCLIKTTKDQKDVYEMINSIILKKLRQGTVPWKKNWNSFGPARNYVTDKPYRAYRGFNALFLGMMGANFDYPLFITFNQVKQLGGSVKKGSKSLPVIYWKNCIILQVLQNQSCQKT